MNSARAWCTGITTNGAGRGAELEQNAAVATEIAKSAVAVSAQLSQVRQLEQSAPQFLEYQHSKTYAGDTYPDGISKLDVMLRAYKEPEDAIGTALAALKAKYGLSDSEL